MRLRDLLQPCAHVLYDTIEVPLPCESGFEFELFRDLMGKTREQTNFDSPMRLSPGERFKLESVLVKTNAEGLWNAAKLVLKVDARDVLNCPLAHLRSEYAGHTTFEDNTDIRGCVVITEPVPGTGAAIIRVEMHGLLATPVPKDWKPEEPK